MYLLLSKIPDVLTSLLSVGFSYKGEPMKAGTLFFMAAFSVLGTESDTEKHSIDTC